MDSPQCEQGDIEDAGETLGSIDNVWEPVSGIIIPSEALQKSDNERNAQEEASSWLHLGAARIRVLPF